MEATLSELDYFFDFSALGQDGLEPVSLDKSPFGAGLEFANSAATLCDTQPPTVQQQSGISGISDTTTANGPISAASLSSPSIANDDIASQTQSTCNDNDRANIHDQHRNKRDKIELDQQVSDTDLKRLKNRNAARRCRQRRLEMIAALEHKLELSEQESLDIRGRLKFAQVEKMAWNQRERQLLRRISILESQLTEAYRLLSR